MNLVVTVDNLIHERNSLSFWERPLAANHFSKISSITEFGNDVCVVASVVNVIDFDNVIAILEVFKDINL